MIKLKCSRSTNPDQIGDFSFGINRIIISDRSASQLRVQLPVTLCLSLSERGLFLINPKNNPLVKLNFDKCEELEELSVKDKISIGKQYLFTINDFKWEGEEDLRHFLNSQTQQYIQDKHPVLELIKQIEGRES